MESVKHDYAATLEELKAAHRGGYVLFEKKLEAARELNQLIETISPRKHHPDMDWGEACGDIAHEFPRLELDLGLYLARHDVVLPAHLRDILHECKNISGQQKFEVQGGDVPPDTRAAAGGVFTSRVQFVPCQGTLVRRKVIPVAMGMFDSKGSHHLPSRGGPLATKSRDRA